MLVCTHANSEVKGNELKVAKALLWQEIILEQSSSELVLRACSGV